MNNGGVDLKKIGIGFLDEESYVRMQWKETLHGQVLQKNTQGYMKA